MEPRPRVAFSHPMCAGGQAGRITHTFPSLPPSIHSRAYDPYTGPSRSKLPPLTWFGRVGRQARTGPSLTCQPNRKEAGRWGPSRSAPPPRQRSKGHAVPRAAPPRAHIGNSAARTGAPPSFRPAKRAPPPVHHPPLRRAGLPHLPACAAVVPPNSPGARWRPCMNGPNPPAGPECEASAFLGVCCMPCPMGGPPCG